MGNDFTRIRFERVFKVESLYTLFYMELSKNFEYEGESHDFWEMVYVDRGSVICQAEKNRFVLKSGEMTFHKPNEFHNLTGDNSASTNVGIVTFECNSRAMRLFDGKIFKLDAEERALLELLFSEGLSRYRLEDENDPLNHTMIDLSDAPFGSSQAIKNVIELFLIKLSRRRDALSKRARRSYLIDGVDIPREVKEILDFMSERVCETLTVRDIADGVGRSESSVKHMFSRYFGEGVIKYFSSMKIKEAKKLIREGALNFSEISNKLSYESPQYFSKCFKRAVGKTPGEYRASIVK